MRKTMDPKLVAAKDDDESEVKYIAKTYHISIKVVRKVAGEVGRSRKEIYKALKGLGYDMVIPKQPQGDRDY